MSYTSLTNNILGPVKKRIKQKVNNKTIFDYFIKHNSSLSFIQIGGYDGLSFDNLFSYFQFIQPKGIILEPVPAYFNQLKNNTAAYPGISLLNFAIHRSSGNMNMYKVRDEVAGHFPEWVKGCAGFYKSQLIRHGVQDDQIEALEVPCMTINDVFLKMNIYGQVDYLQMDCEGYDGQIILGLDTGRFKPCVIKFEHVNLALNELKQVRKKLQMNGYVLLNEGTDTLAVRYSFFIKVLIS